MKDFASWITVTVMNSPGSITTVHTHTHTYIKKSDAPSFFIKVTISQTSHYAGGFCGTDARWSSQRWLEFNFSLPFLWHYQGCGCGYEKCVAVCVHTTLYTSVVVCATFGSLACCLHLNPQEMENGSQFLKLMLRSDSLKMQILSAPADKSTVQQIITDKSLSWHLKTELFKC